MLIRRLKEDSIELTEIEPLEAELLRKVPSVCDAGGDPKAESRLFSSPADPGEQQFLTDWDEYVRPELSHLFLSARRRIWKSFRIGRAVSAGWSFRWRMARPG